MKEFLDIFLFLKEIIFCIVQTDFFFNVHTSNTYSIKLVSYGINLSMT